MLIAGSLVAEEHSEDEEPATTSADEDASKKANTEQQKQLSKKVSLPLLSHAGPVHAHLYCFFFVQ